jgi:CRISPR-associated protein Csx17
MPTLPLSGCAPVPLAHYLKALGILRLVSEQKDPKATGRWHRDQFVLESSLDREALLKFFLEEYQPTPIMAPWNGGSGFHPKDNSKALDAVQGAKAGRLKPYGASLHAARTVLKSMNLGEKPTPEQKADLLLLCRNALHEDALQWLDAAYVLTEVGAKYPPLLGTGGNDGRLEFTNNFMQRITEVIDTVTGTPRESSAARLAVALFADVAAAPPAKAPVGQFLPGTAGGANATSGFDAPASVNPWDFILMIEGALLFASASVKRLESADIGALAYPFCVRQAGVGYASAAGADESASRAEMWMPLWSRRAVTLPELTAILSEGRAQVGARAARNGVDFARAVVGLGVDRGLEEFQRYGFQVRNGLSYFATPLTRIAVKRDASTDLLNDIDSWLSRYRSAATKDTAPASARRALSTLETAIVDLCVSHSPERLLRVFLALGQCQAAAARSLKWASDPKNYLSPLQRLSRAWLKHELWNDPRIGTEFRLAASLASINQSFSKKWLPFRCHLEAVESKPYGYKWAENPRNDVQWSQAPLPNVLNDILARRLLKTPDEDKVGGIPASLADVKAFIEQQTDDDLLGDLLWSMSLIDWQEKADLPATGRQPQPVPPTFYALMKLCFPPAKKDLPEGILPVPIVPGIHRHASTGNGEQAATLALRRLRASGYHPKIKTMPVQGEQARRSAAAIILPIHEGTLEKLLFQITRPEKESPENTPTSTIHS